MMSNPYMTAALAEQHRADLLRQVEQHRLVRAAKARPRPTHPTTVLAKETRIKRQGFRKLRPTTNGAMA